ncbi:MAG: DUF4199 domain-containing protein [Bacteroidetes bacterium]|nr:DUF4199 domain-containing protein [Bacteroidota bacterium]
MKRIVLTYGAINAAIMACMFTISTVFREQIGFQNAMYIGFANIILGSSMIYFAIASYKKNNGGEISFGKAFKIGVLLSLIAAAVYATIWMILINTVMSNFCEEVHKYTMENLQKTHASAEKIADAKKEMKMVNALMKNPPLLFLEAMFVECFPVGLIISLISAAILRTKKPATA